MDLVVLILIDSINIVGQCLTKKINSVIYLRTEVLVANDLLMGWWHDLCSNQTRMGYIYIPEAWVDFNLINRLYFNLKASQA